jgi:hypothetical protein
MDDRQRLTLIKRLLYEPQDLVWLSELCERLLRENERLHTVIEEIIPDQAPRLVRGSLREE